MNRLLIASFAGLLALVACSPARAMPTPDIPSIQTAAVASLVAQITATAAVVTPTEAPTETAAPTTSPTDTPAPAAATKAALCDHYTWTNTTVDVNVPDGSKMTPGQKFTKTWKIKNDGECTWGAGYQVMYAGYADKMSGVPDALPPVVAPGEEIEISVQFLAPLKSGDYVSAWTLRNPKGTAFFGPGAKPLYVKITVAP